MDAPALSQSGASLTAVPIGYTDGPSVSRPLSGATHACSALAACRMVGLTVRPIRMISRPCSLRVEEGGNWSRPWSHTVCVVEHRPVRSATVPRAVGVRRVRGSDTKGKFRLSPVAVPVPRRSARRCLPGSRSSRVNTERRSPYLMLGHPPRDRSAVVGDNHLVPLIHR